MPAELNKPVGTLTDRPSNPIIGSNEGHFNNIGVAQMNQPTQRDTMPATYQKPVGTLTDRPSNPVYGTNEGQWNNIGVA